MAGLFLISAIAYLVMPADLSPGAMVFLKPMPVVLLSLSLRLKRGFHPLFFGLWFSALGDIFLLNKAQFFLLGMGAFALAHLLYIAFFWLVLKQKIWILLWPFAAWAIGLLTWLWPGLGEMRIPVCVYGSLLCSMMWLAASWAWARPRKTWPFALLGGLCFGISDSLLAIALFKTDFAGSNLAIMLTYWLGQWGITSAGASDER